MDLLQSFGIEGKLLFWQIINFGVLFAVLWYVLYKPLRRIMGDREAQIKESLTRAEIVEKEARDQEARLASQMDAERRELKEMQAAAIAEQDRMSKQLRLRAEEDAKRIVEESRKAVAEEKDRLLTSLEDDVKRLAVTLAGKIVQKKIGPEDERQMLDEALKLLRGANKD